MKRLFLMLLISYSLANGLFSQTTELTMLLLLRNYLNDNLCQDLSNSKNLLKLIQKGDTCIFKCNVDNLSIKADSTILTIGKWSTITGDYIELCQYFNNIDSAMLEYNEYVTSLIQEFNVDTNFYKYKIIKIKNFDSTYKIDVFQIHSLYVSSLLFISLEQGKQNYVINTRIK